ncbi:MAG: alpha-galactosidase, partial [bacterium]|nr:alpha-galactosidase [bacterium]
MQSFQIGLITEKGAWYASAGESEQGISRLPAATVSWDIDRGPDHPVLSVAITAEEDMDAGCDLVVYRISVPDLQRELGMMEPGMLANALSIRSGEGGLCRLTREGLKKDADAPDPVSWWWTLLGDEDAAGAHLYGFLSPVRHRSFLRIRDGWFECGCMIQRPLKKGETFTADSLMFMEGEPYSLLERFGDLTAAAHPGRVSSQRPVGWNSWDYYFSMFDNSDLDETLDAIEAANRKLPVPVRHVILDMGWFTEFGDWYANGRFPGGMREAAEKIRSRGLIPGVWLAPFIVHFFSRIFLRHPEVCATDTEGRVVMDNWGLAPNGYLDPTSPAGEEYLYGVFKRLFDEGFRYFKLDFIHYPITQGATRQYYRNEIGRMEMLREGLHIIRRAVGDESFILACGCPLEAALGVADGCRIGGDISTYHSTVKVQTPFLATRWWMNNRFFTSDPDFAMVRCDDTADDRHHNPYHAPNMVDAVGSRSGSPW